MKKFIFIILLSLFGLTKVSAQAATAWFITQWDTTKASAYSANNNDIKFNLLGNNIRIEYQNIAGGGWTVVTTTASSGLQTITFPAPGSYRVRFFGAGFSRFFLNTQTPSQNCTAERFINVEQWGTNAWSAFDHMFKGAVNMTQITAGDLPVLTNVTSMIYTFDGCINLTNINNLNSWNVSNVTNLFAIFRDCAKFNQNISSWNVSKVIDFTYVFAGCKIFNQPVNSWNTSSAVIMIGTFANASLFNQPLNNWNTAKVVNMNAMFSEATNFNQNINNWNVSNVTDFSLMFRNCKVYNQPLNNWNTSKAIFMNEMFSGALLFNQPLNSWNVSLVRKMGMMFYIAYSFNQPLNSWNTSLVNDMWLMFSGAIKFNQNIGNFVLNNTFINGMFQSSGMSANKITETLNLWNSNNSTVSSSVNFLSTKSYCLPSTVITSLQGKGFNFNSGTSNCKKPGIVYMENNPILNGKTLVGVKNNGAFEWLAEYDNLSLPDAPTANGIFKFSATADKTVVRHTYPDDPSTSSIRNSTLINSIVTSPVNIETLPSSTVITGQAHLKRKIVFDAVNNKFYEGTATNWARIDN